MMISMFMAQLFGKLGFYEAKERAGAARLMALFANGLPGHVLGKNVPREPQIIGLPGAPA